MTADEHALRTLIARWNQASERGDTDAVLALMTEDVVFLGPGRAPMRGKPAFAEGMRSWMAQWALSTSTEILEIAIDGTLATCWARLEVRATPLSGGAPVIRRGDVLSVYRRHAGGDWLLARDANLLALAS